MRSFWSGLVVILAFAPLCLAVNPGAGSSAQGQLGQTADPTRDRERDPTERGGGETDLSDWENLQPMDRESRRNFNEAARGFISRLWRINYRQRRLREDIAWERAKPRDERSVEDLEEWREELENLEREELELWERLDQTTPEFLERIERELNRLSEAERQWQRDRGNPNARLVDVRDPRTRPAPRTPGF